MPTTYTKGILLNGNTHAGVVASHAAINGLAAFTWIMCAKRSGTDSDGLLSRGNVTNGIFVSSIFDGRVQVRADRAGGASLWYDEGLGIDDVYRWLFLTFNRATGAHTVFGGPLGGTITALSSTHAAVGSGAIIGDDDFDFRFGNNIGQNATDPCTGLYIGIMPSVMTLSQCQAFAADPLAATGLAGFWKPEAGATTSIPNGVVTDPLRPPMALSGATIVAGPDVPDVPAGLSAAVLRRRRRQAAGATLY